MRARRPTPVAPARRAPAVLGGFLLAAVLGGCTLAPKLGPPPQVGPPYIPPPEPVWVVLDPALYQTSSDSARAPTGGRTTTIRPRAATIGPSQFPSDPTGTEPPPTSGEPREATNAAQVESTRTPALSVDLPSADRWQLTDAARRNLAATDSLTRRTRRGTLSSRDRAKLENALGLMRQAEDALRRGDLRAAANLAYKARLLAGEVGR